MIGLPRPGSVTGSLQPPGPLGSGVDLGDGKVIGQELRWGREGWELFFSLGSALGIPYPPQCEAEKAFPKGRFSRHRKLSQDAQGRPRTYCVSGDVDETLLSKRTRPFPLLGPGAPSKCSCFKDYILEKL